MSMSTDSYYGFGFFCENTETEKAKEFFKRHIATVEKLGEEDALEIINSEDGDIEEIEVDAEFGYCWKGFLNLIANVMTKETGIRFSCYSGDNGSIAIMLLESLPWYWNEVEINLTKDILTDILKKYAEELGLSKDIDYVKIEVFG